MMLRGAPCHQTTFPPLRGAPTNHSTLTEGMGTEGHSTLKRGWAPPTKKGRFPRKKAYFSTPRERGGEVVHSTLRSRGMAMPKKHASTGKHFLEPQKKKADFQLKHFF